MFNKILWVILGLLGSVNVAGGKEADKLFHRLLLLNDKQELLVVKIKNTDFWVTPGLYATSDEPTEQKLHEQAAEYGLSLSELDLKGQIHTEK